LLCGLLIAAFAAIAAAQSNQPTFTIVPAQKIWTVATGNNLYCAGYIQTSAISEGNKIIGATDEADKYNFSQNDFLYLNMGANKGVNVGDLFAVVRPRAQVKSKWSNKGDLGSYVQEVGAVEVVSVKSDFSVARIKSSCDSFLFGDLVQLIEPRTSPAYEQRPPLDLFADYTGKPTGRILMARDATEMIARDFIVYVDLGADNNVHVGDHLTIYRPLGNGNPYNPPENEAVTARDYGFESETYKGGKFSNQAPRKTGSHAGGHEVAIDEAKSGRPKNLRKIVGEAVVLNVKEKTSTVVITRTASEIHTGDRVELQ
jgi:hypothetical protein